ncbi:MULTISPECIES: elongation factor P [Phaeodactylibacter]|jgi:elongation factor P|uniref:Elongation factor P n=1 Tax=Phaeodactylibacter xiamenensis TaxID=1524460 RepID=A0A098S8B0_9BACT|nr:MULTISPECIES: elongation factor P [Phaeodactylibacter]KGE87913.1 elongation factor P [Phaeodactylibacter xiamenensis]MCI4648176.1 elongation factor P [Phaeodactylibacter sp.]MCI5091969.1 elongation factor P [Phaeodactylibacter sp.]MCR9055046.1 elongation factor P [bacterium]
MATTSDIRKGMCIDFNNDIFTIIEFQHVKPGKGAAFVRTKIKSLTSGKVLDNTFSAGHKVDEVRVERRKFQYLYSDDMGYHFMNNETYEQVALSDNIVEHAHFLKEGMEVDVIYHADREVPLTMEMPQYIILEVTYTEPGVKGDTATNTLKPATVETGAEVRVPLFINQGDKVKIEVETGAYMERVKQ